MFNTFKRLILGAAIGVLAVGAFGQVTLNGGHVSSGAIAHAWNGGSTSSTCSVAMAMSDTVSDANPAVGETITYTLTGTPAFTASTTVTVTDQLGAGLTFVSANPSVGTYSSSTGTWNVGTLNGASIITLSLVAKVNAGTEGMTIDNRPTVNYVQSNCTQSQAVLGVSVTVQGSSTVTPTSTPTSTTQYADLRVVKTADATSTVEGGTIHYTINVTDLGPATSTGVVATDLLPNGLKFVSAVPSAGSYASSTGVWTIGTLPASSTATLAITATVKSGTSGSTIKNTASATESTSTVDNDLSNNSSSVSVKVKCGTPTSTIQYADLSVHKTADATSTVEGGTVRYVVTVTNLGPATSTGVVATDTLPSGLTFQNATASAGSYDSSTGAWTIGTLKSGSSATLAIAATVKAGTAGSTIVNTASATESTSTVDNDLSNNSSSVSIAVPVPPSTPTATIVATKIICPSVSDLPDLSGGAAITSSTAAAFLASHPACHAAPGWDFQWGTASASDPNLGGSFVGPSTSTDWTAFGPTNASGTASVAIANPQSYSWFWMREVLQSGYIGFSYYPGHAVNDASSSAEMFCHTDVLNYDNYDRVDGPQNGGTYYCVAWNVAVATSTPTSTVTGYSITKSLDDASPVTGDTVHYTVTVGNIGSATATSVVATDVLPSGLSLVSATASQGSYATSTGIWAIGTLPASSTAMLQVAAQVTAPAGTSITNTATVASSTASVTLTVASGTPTSTPVADLSITKTVDNAAPNPGATVNYTLTVKALGPATSTGVVATDTLPSGLTFEHATASVGSYATSTGTWTIGDMSPSSTATLEIAALVNASDTIGMTITNIGLVGESPSSTNTNTNTSSSVTVTVTSPGCTVNCGGGAIDAALSVEKTANVTSTLPGGTVIYTITATAGGPNPSTGVVATDTLPSGLTFQNATASAGSYNLTTGTWTIGTLAPSSTATLEIAALVNASGTAGTTITNDVTIGEDPTLTNTSPNTSAHVSVAVGIPAVANQADLSIVKTVDNANPAAGATVNFTVTVTNNGPDTATFVYATDQMPGGLSFSAATSSQGLYNMSTGNWDIGTLAPNATATLMVAAVVGTNTAGTSIANTATVSSTLASLVDPDPANNSSTVTLSVQGGGGGCTGNCGFGGTVYDNIGIVKTVDNANPAAGSTIHYTLTVSNSGPSTATGVSANDVLPSGLAFVSASASQGSYANGVWTIGTINVGQSMTLTITATVNAAAAGTSITNTGSLAQTGLATDSDPTNNSSSVTITVAGGGGGGGGGGLVLGTSTGQVLGASCGLYLTSYIHPVRKDLNDPEQVMKLQRFLNQNLGLALPITGYYGNDTIAAVNQFQTKYHLEVLRPWLPLGLPTEFTPTSYVYQTTQRWINLIMCPSLNLPMPQLMVDQGGA